MARAAQENTMLSSLLLHFNGSQSADAAIELGVELAKKWNLRIRGLTLLDTRRFSTLASVSESAIYCNTELGRLNRIEKEQCEIRSKLSAACLEAEVDFDVRRVKGDPFDVLPFESQFHDLVVTAFPSAGNSERARQILTPAELVSLLARGVQPLFILRTSAEPIRRVLLASDGTAASTRAVRQFLQLHPFPEAEHRVLAVDYCEARAREVLREMVEYVRGRLPRFESGWLEGAMRRVLVPYALKWGADLVVTGVAKRNPILKPLLAEPVELILRKTNMGLYVMA